jgi:cytochrome c oxidase subunit 4
MVFVALFICTLLSILFDVIDPSNKAVLIVLVLSVAMAKALFVMTYFMHLKFEGNWKFVLLAPTAILAVGLPMALLPDIGQHYYFYAAPQSQYLPRDRAEASAHEGSTTPPPVEHQPEGR